MNEATEQQLMALLTEISQDLKMLVTLTKDQTRLQTDATEKAYGQLVNIAHKR